MSKAFVPAIAAAILWLFLIQLAGTLVESIYILNLLNTSLNAKVLGLLFFFTPALLLLLRGLAPGWWVWVLFVTLFIARGMLPYLNTSTRLVASGMGLSAALLILPVVFSARLRDERRAFSGLALSAGLALATGLSVLLRSLGFGLDYALSPGGGWLGWVLASLLGMLLAQLDWTSPDAGLAPSRPPTGAVFGLFMTFSLVYFAFSAPAVIARWTSGSYAGIVLATSLLALGWAAAAFYRPGLLGQISPRMLALWNALFALALTGTILAHQVAFPASPGSPAVVVGAPTWLQQALLVLMLLLYPVIFADMGVFASQVRGAAASPRAWAPGLLLGSLMLIVLLFMHIFTNVWGYVEPVSPWFRNKFWLPFALLGAILTLLTLRPSSHMKRGDEYLPATQGLSWAGLLGMVFLFTAAGVWRSNRTSLPPAEPSALVVMTYNIQQANTEDGEKSYAQQLALIQRVNPDLVALQENDSTRLGLNNNDYVRYFASQLGYYSYYGPSTVAGTYGTAILSRYPLENPLTIYTYSDQDEIATTTAQIEVAGQQFTVFNVHPDGSDAAMEAFAHNLLERASSKENVIILGDFNLRQSEPAYQMVASTFTNAWLSVYPGGIDSNGLDMSGDKRIDHIFISPHLRAIHAAYVLPPDSWTDHPVHWAEITWQR